MLHLLFLFFVHVLGVKQNFQVQGLNGVNTSQALSQCFAANLCTSATGCCNGHGVCNANQTSQYCVCGTPQDCRPGLSPIPSYTGTTCSTVAIDPGCCKDGSSDYIFALSGVCNKRDGTDAESGSKGRLLQRLGSPNYNDSCGSLQDSSLSQLFAFQNDMLTNGTVTTSKFNMMTLGYLQVALKDMVHLDYYPVSEQNITFNGTTYPKVRWQTNTGVSGSPKMFENTATAIIDVGPLYDYATKVGSGPYLNATPAVTYWANTHHMTTEFILTIKFLGLYHNYVAANVEDYFCGAHSTNTSTHGNTCTTTVANQYDLARRSTIRFFQNIVESAALYFGVDTDLTATEEPYFYVWWSRDVDYPTGAGSNGIYETKIRTGAEFSDDITNTNLQHHLISALDFFISARNPNTNTTAYALFGGSPCGYNPANVVYPGGQSPAQIIQDVINHFHTRTQRFGSKIASAYASETALLLYRANELGLSSYKNVISNLTGSISSSDITTHKNVFYGVHKESNNTRKYASTTPLVVLASLIDPLNDVIMIDRTGLFAIDEWGFWFGRNYHPDPSLIQSPDYEFANCYKGGGSDCTLTAWKAAGVLTGQILYEPTFTQNNVAMFSRGALGAAPQDYVQPKSWDQLAKMNAGFPLINDIINPLLYQFDGIASQAYKYNDNFNWALPNVINDVIPGAIGWVGYLDGKCFAPTYIQGNAQWSACNRQRSSQDGNGECYYYPDWTHVW